MTFDARGDRCLSIWADAYASGVMVFPPHARVLEIGCAEADWQTSMLAIRPDLHITGIDWRKTTRPGVTIQGDVLTQDFAPGSFDVVIGVSSIEHIGLGHYEADPGYIDGDVSCMARVAQWLAPGGWAYLDVPYNAAGYAVHGTKCRIYDNQALRTRLIPPGLTEAHRWYCGRKGQCFGSTPPATDAPPPAFDYVALHLTTA